MTKGALYHHFNSNEALAVAIIDQAFGILLKTFQGVSRSFAPALQSMIHGVLVVAELANTDKLARMAAVLLRIFAKSSARRAHSTTESGSRRWGGRHSERRSKKTCAATSTLKRQANSSSPRCSGPR